jgi:pimeloyl-ACP methyl ester carboxylesterase
VRSVAVDIDPEEFAGATARECSAYITGVLENHQRVILVGTSCSGLIIPVVSMDRPIDHLVFVCAGLPDIGRSATDQISVDGLLHEEWMKQWDYDNPEVATTFMFNDCDGDALEWSLSTVRVFVPQLVYDEVTPLTAWPDIPSTYLLGTKDQIISQDWARAAVPARLGGEPIELETGHCPQNSRPATVADILVRVAGAQP